MFVHRCHQHRPVSATVNYFDAQCTYHVIPIAIEIVSFLRLETLAYIDCMHGMVDISRASFIHHAHDAFLKVQYSTKVSAYSVKASHLYTEITSSERHTE